MQVLITGKGIELTEAIKNYVDEKISSLEKFDAGVIRAVVVVGMETHHHQKGNVFFAECKLEVPGSDLFAERKEPVLYAAVDKLRDHLETELRKYKEGRFGKKDKAVMREQKEYQPDEE